MGAVARPTATNVQYVPAVPGAPSEAAGVPARPTQRAAPVPAAPGAPSEAAGVPARPTRCVPAVTAVPVAPSKAAGASARPTRSVAPAPTPHAATVPCNTVWERVGARQTASAAAASPAATPTST